MDRKVSATGWFPVSNSQIQITKPGPRPKGGDSEGEISRFQVSGFRCQGRKTIKLKPETSIFSSTLQAFFELADHKSTQIGKICLS